MACCCGLCVPNMIIAKAKAKENLGEFICRLSITKANAKTNLQIFICNHFLCGWYMLLLHAETLICWSYLRCWVFATYKGNHVKRKLFFNSTTYDLANFSDNWKNVYLLFFFLFWGVLKSLGSGEMALTQPVHFVFHSVVSVASKDERQKTIPPRPKQGGLLYSMVCCWHGQRRRSLAQQPPNPYKTYTHNTSTHTQIKMQTNKKTSNHFWSNKRKMFIHIILSCAFWDCLLSKVQQPFCFFSLQQIFKKWPCAF